MKFLIKKENSLAVGVLNGLICCIPFYFVLFIIFLVIKCA